MPDQQTGSAGSAPACCIDHTRSCNGCLAAGPRDCPYPYLLGVTVDARGADPPTLGCMAATPASSLWPILHYDDTRAVLRFLVDVLGFREALTVEDDRGDVVHAELRWPGGGALVLGSTRHTDGVHGGMRAGANALYLVTEDVDAVHARVRAAHGDVVAPPHDTTFGSGAASYTFTARDPEGNLWTVGTYRGVA